MKKIYKLIISILVCQLVGFAGSLATTPSIETWYKTLNKPSFSPPNWIFAPVWTILFILMGVSAYLIWNKGLKDKKIKEALSFFLVQLFLNFLWSFIFFRLHQPALAFLEIIILWLMIFITYKKFSTISKKAGYLLIPYLAWVAFAGLLNLAIASLN